MWDIFRVKEGGAGWCPTMATLTLPNLTYLYLWESCIPWIDTNKKCLLVNGYSIVLNWKLSKSDYSCEESGVWNLCLNAYFNIGFILYFRLNLRTGPKDSNEISAYSVFNKDFRRIHGTYTSEQFEREMLFRRWRVAAARQVWNFPEDFVDNKDGLDILTIFKISIRIGKCGYIRMYYKLKCPYFTKPLNKTFALILYSTK